MSDTTLIDIPYLEGIDINDDGSLKSYVGNGKPVIVMVQGNFCHYCTQAKPAVKQLANSLSNVVVATVQIDGKENDISAAEKLKKVNTSPGVPAFLGFDKTGRFKSIHQGGRDVASLQGFAQTL